MLHTGWWPTFNLADIYITIGVATWIIMSIRAFDDTHNGAASSTAEKTTT